MTAPEIQQEIERTQDHLGETVDELAARADVKATGPGQGRRDEGQGGRDVRAAAPEPGRQNQLVQGDLVRRRWPLAAAAAGAVLVGSVLVRRRRRR